MPVLDSHFSNFFDGGSLVVGDTVVGLRNGINTRFTYTGGVGIFLPLAGGTMTGSINMDGNIIFNSGAPSAGGDLTNKTYVDSVVGSVSPLTTKGDIWTYSTINTRLAVGSIDGQILQVSSGAATGLAWSTATYPLTTTANQLLFSTSNNVITGLASGNDGVLITSFAGVPSISSTLPGAVQLNITLLGTQAQALNMGSHLINNVTDPVSAQDAMTLHYAGITYLALAGGTMTGNINMGGFKATNAADPLNPQDYATKFYVDQTSLTGTQVYAATTTNLTVTQSGAGVGATLTNAGVQATFALDGVNPPLNSSVLIKDLANAANEGIYTVSNVGSGSSNWVLTRSTSYDTAAEINNTGLIVILNGSTLQGTAWYNTTTIVTVDTTNFSYSEFGNIVFPISLAHGGTNANLTASNGGIVYSTATSMAILAGTATAGQMLRSGASGPPSWSTATFPSTSGASGKIMQSDGTNWIASTATWPTAATSGKFVTANGTNYVESTSTIPTSAGATAGKALVSDGTNYILSSFAFPTTVGATGTLLRSDGTNWVATTSTYPNTNAVNTLLYASSANVMAALATVNSAGLLTSAGGVPGWVAYTGTGAPVLGTSPTITTPHIITSILDTNGNTIIGLVPNATAVNYLEINNAAAASSPSLSAKGSDTNINLNLLSKGTGSVVLLSNNAVALTASSAVSAVNYIGIGATATGVGPTITATGTDSDIYLQLISKGNAGVVLQSNGAAVLNAANPASPVNYFTMVGSATGNAIGLLATGTDSNVPMLLTAKGTGAVTIANASGTANILSLNAVASAVNYVNILANATGSNPAIFPIGDANITLQIQGSGTGGVYIVGVGTNTNAVTGQVGELLSAANLAASPITFTTGVAKTLQTITLTPGDWDVWGNIFCSGTTVVTAQVGLHTTTNTQPDNSLTTYLAGLSTSSALGNVAPQRRVSVAANTSYFLVGTFTGTGTLSASGGIYARRRR